MGLFPPVETLCNQGKLVLALVQKELTNYSTVLYTQNGGTVSEFPSTICFISCVITREVHKVFAWNVYYKEPSERCGLTILLTNWVLEYPRTGGAWVRGYAGTRHYQGFETFANVSHMWQF